MHSSLLSFLLKRSVSEMPGLAASLGLGLSCLLLSLPADAAPAAPVVTATAKAPAAAAAYSAQVALDGVYIPALFLTGSAPKSADGPARASAAMQRLSQAWPERRLALAACFASDAGWQATLAEVEALIRKAAAEVQAGQWPQSHETLEHVRDKLLAARSARGLDYLLDDLTRFHGVMESLAGATQVDRPAMLAQFSQARAMWWRLENRQLNATALGLSQARLTMWQAAAADESDALSRLSDALRQADDAAVLKAASAIKAPFVRAYTAFGWPAGENPVLPR